MIEQQARVIRTQGDLAWVSVGRQSGCAACDAGKGCGAGIFGRLLRRKPVELELPNSIQAVPGQPVTLGMPEALFMKIVFRLYGWPLLGGLAGALICHQIAKTYFVGDGIIDLMALIGMVTGAAISIVYLRRRGSPDIAHETIHLLASAAEDSCHTFIPDRSAG